MIGGWWMFQMFHIQLNSLSGRCFSLGQIFQVPANTAGHWTKKQLTCWLQQNSLWFGNVCQPHLQLIRSWWGMTISFIPVFDTQVALSGMVLWLCMTFLQDQAFVIAIYQALTKLEVPRITPKLRKRANWFALTLLSNNSHSQWLFSSLKKNLVTKQIGLYHVYIYISFVYI